MECCYPSLNWIESPLAKNYGQYSFYYELYQRMTEEYRTQIALAIRINPHAAYKAFNENAVLAVRLFHPVFKRTVPEPCNP